MSEIDESPAAEDSASEGAAHEGLRERVRHDVESAVARVEASPVGTYWGRLNAVDFMNSSFVFASLFLLCLFPFLAVVDAASGNDVRKNLVLRMGLHGKAADDINNLISSGHRAVNDLSILGGLLLVLGAIGIASTLQLWFQRVFEQPHTRGTMRVLLVRVVWVALFAAYLILQVVIGDALHGTVVVVYVCEFALTAFFWTWSAYLLLNGQVPWRSLVALGVATAICITGLGIFSTLLFSSQVVSGQNDYGPVGVVMVLMSYLIGWGVCIHLGAVFGRMWLDRRPGRYVPPGSPATAAD
jgi:membrane protein